MHEGDLRCHEGQEVEEKEEKVGAEPGGYQMQTWWAPEGANGVALPGAASAGG